MTKDEGKWRRAIVYIAWGKPYIEQACAAAETAAFLDVALVLVTDRANAKFVPRHNPFTDIHLLDQLKSYDMLVKSTVFDVSPSKFNSILYLDTDTVVLGDLSFGFEMAEKHGIALSPATSYCLPSHHEFRRIMLGEGLRDAGQLQYNAGVHFFVRRPDVAEVYRLYQRSAYDLSKAYEYTNARGKLADQPFLTFAMEKLGFNPYTLSINYCYRGIDAEPVCGDVRIWHSHHPVPQDVNAYESHQGPRRRYVRGQYVDMRPVYAHLAGKKP